MTFSTRTILFFIAACAVALVVSPHLDVPRALVAVCSVGICVYFFLPWPRRRYFFYAAAVGVLIGAVAVSSAVNIRYGHLPDVPVPLGRGQFNPNATRRPDIVYQASNRELPYGITLGFVTGALIGFKITTKSARRTVAV